MFSRELIGPLPFAAWLIFRAKPRIKKFHVKQIAGKNPSLIPHMLIKI